MSPLLIVHVVAGSLGIISGGAALSVRKGERLHRAFGTAFFASMMVMAATGAYLAVLQPHAGTAAVGVLTCYFVATAWATARRRQGLGAFEKVAFVIPAGLAAALLMFGLQAQKSATGEFQDVPPAPYFAFAGLAVFVAAADLSLVLRGGVKGAQRIARHLWRMCIALSFAAGNFFLGQQQVLPVFLQGSPLLFAPVLAPLAPLAYWLLRLRFTNWWREDAAAS